MSRHSARNWDGSHARHHGGECVVICTDDGRHGERVVGRLTWKRDDVNPADPRWSPEGLVLSRERGEIIRASADHGASVRLHCDTCHRDLQRTWAWVENRTRRLLEADVRKVDLIHLIRLP